MSIKRNIWALPALSTLIFTVGVAVSSSFSLQALSSIRATQDVDYPLMDQSKALLAQVQAVTGALRDAVTEGDKSRMAQVGELAVKVRGMLQTIAAVPGQEAPAAQLGREFDAYYAAANTTTRIMLGIDKGDPNATIGTMQSAQKVLETHLQAAIAAAQGQFETGIARSADNVRKVMAITIAVAALVIVGLVTVSYFVVRAIWRQLGGEPEYAREIARAVADGDLSMSIAVDARDRSSLLAALKEMQTRLEGMAGNIMTSTRTITMASQDMASENTELASRTDKQVSSLEQTARSMGTLTDTVRQNAQSARTANDLADSASAVARQGGRVVGQVVATMQQINKSARNIVDIISVIDGIAFQTNILALNAAVEASRAGEQGRGFAVVATEVRNLAQRSALAAKEIKTLIDDSVNKITLGSQLVDQAGGTMNDIVSSVQRVTAIMGEITLASDAQNGGIQKINQAIGLIDEMTRRNSALVEQASISTRSLREQADRLGAAVAVFKLSDAAREPEASAA